MLGTRKARLVLAALVAVVGVVAFGVGGWWFFIRDDAPERASAENVAETPEEASEADDAAGPEDAAGDSVEGEWTIDPTIGRFDDFSGSYVGYRVEEELASIGGQTAVGRTPDVTGSITVEGEQVTAASFEVDMTTLRSDQGLRDNALKTRGLETDTYPSATFELTTPLDIPGEAAATGARVDVEVDGEVTLHGVTREVTITLTAQLVDGVLGINGSTPIGLADYQIPKPEGLAVLSIADEGLLEFQLFLTQV